MIERFCKWCGIRYRRFVFRCRAWRCSECGLEVQEKEKIDG